MECQIIGQSIIILEQTPSTNNYATDQVRENEVKEGTVFLAVAQTAGRGHLANKWESAAGKNLTFSIYIRPNFLPIEKSYMLSKVVCLGLERYLSRFVDQVRIKWPNDVYVGDRKICGILIENGIMRGEILQSIIGIGLNINQEKFVSDAPNPVSLFQLTGETRDLEEQLKELLSHIDLFYQKLAKGEYEEVSDLFVSKLYRLNEWHWFKDDQGKYFGKIIGVNEIGQLLVEDESKNVRAYHFKEVSYLI
ncbi:biotin--[acetyl-CoA-carboxylase] ligase [Mangrovibacterium diazotrophicum]|uniref:BirA family biotin operon repressor/biotin-[acetyl-CoA-carboxylase] ligase n=1 Tax=Mangrovibacterium diazotrophicum TaxID=1261403 RepID=A0A419W7E4_9BACT|nr:biotin--[acetyl-CoA-carboxylase] ligase [Mangrovibacterium diazotrophicum]RKD91393.1 BirA family biotin operon repressor/biotin-[acetyl-CoA-carboxylase] ligase [Mangrovibacterium diazotrophicum]